MTDIDYGDIGGIYTIGLIVLSCSMGELYNSIVGWSIFGVGLILLAIVSMILKLLEK